MNRGKYCLMYRKVRGTRKKATRHMSSRLFRHQFKVLTAWTLFSNSIACHFFPSPLIETEQKTFHLWFINAQKVRFFSRTKFTIFQFSNINYSHGFSNNIFELRAQFEFIFIFTTLYWIEFVHFAIYCVGLHERARGWMEGRKSWKLHAEIIGMRCWTTEMKSHNIMCDDV